MVAPSPILKSTTKPMSTYLWLAVGSLAMLAGLFAPQFLPDGTASTPIRTSEVSKTAKAVDPDYDPAAWSDHAAPQAMLLRLAFGTMLVLGLVVITLVAARPWIAQWGAPKPAGEHLRLVESLSLGSRCYLHLVQVANQQFLVGADLQGIKSVNPVAEVFDLALQDLPAPTVEE